MTEENNSTEVKTEEKTEEKKSNKDKIMLIAYVVVLVFVVYLLDNLVTKVKFGQ